MYTSPCNGQQDLLNAKTSLFLKVTMTTLKHRKEDQTLRDLHFTMRCSARMVLGDV
jgi:hypothetical protein